MFQRAQSSLLSIFKAITATEEKICCYHCGEGSRRSCTIYILFDGETRAVCCYGCAAILKTVDELNIHDEYRASKINIPDTNK